MERQQRIFYGALSLLGLLVVGWGLARAGAEGVAFGLFAFLTLGGALVCIWERSVVRSAFALMATFSGIAGFFVLLEADFLAMAQILIYVGGILALLLFGVMLSPPDLTERKLVRVFGALVGVGLGVAWLGFQVHAATKWAREEVLQPTPNVDPDVTSAERIGIGFLAPDQYVVAFELAAIVLTVALVAAVYIARRKRSDLEPEAAGLATGVVKGEGA